MSHINTVLVQNAQLLNNPNQSQVSAASNADPKSPAQVEPLGPQNLFQKLSKAIQAVQEENNESQVKNLSSLVDKMTPRLFLKACKERGDSIMEFIGPEIEENGGNIKKAIESVGDYVSDVIWNEILEAANMD